ncbi:MAG: glycosyltransferase family 2 protein [Deltaproteobacteria bacterium]|nr:glycosyltransferase family 2 protein [Deltaproteobacteria bacterium]
MIDSLSIVIMAFDEEENLPVQMERTVAFLSEHMRDWQIVVVDDGSRDRTGEVADAWAARHPEHVDVVHHPTNRGMGVAIRNGYAAARCDWVTQLPADCQVDPRVFLRFFPHVPEADIVLSVYRQRDDGLKRAVMSKGFQLLVRLLIGQRGDTTGTMLFRRDLLERVGPLHSDSFFVNLEFPIRALRSGARHAMVEIEAQPRLHGHSKVDNLRRIRHVAREALAMRRRERAAR